ncbi:MAG: FAD-binding protein [Thermoprotei archaeon]
MTALLTPSETTGYPPELRKAIKIVEETRQDRLRQSYRRLSLEEREKLIRQWHPDYKPGTKRPLRIGVNKGTIVYNEVADILEAWPLIDPKDIDLNNIDYDVDVLIIGGGGAAAAAALWSMYSGVKPDSILVATKLRFGDANTVKAQGGIQAADRPVDSPVRHYLDTIGGGHFANKPELVKALVMDGPFIIKWLEDLGVMFDKTGEGEMIEYSGGGASRRRLHCARDYTGLEIMRVLKDEVLNHDINVLEFNPAVELLTDPDTGAVSGAVLMNLETREYYVVRAKVTILATGGFGRLHLAGFPTTNHYGATADGIVMAYRVGANLLHMDTAQYHPTGVAWPEAILGELITEKCRSLGAQLVNANGELFIYELEPRDVVASAIIRECHEGRGIITPTGACGVWLDLPMIELKRGPGTIKRALPAMYRQFIRHGIDITQEPVLTYPTLHYQNGGIEINAEAMVLNPRGEWIRGLLAAGEVTGGVHGRNRLMGNSLLDILVFGRRAGITAAKFAKETAKPKLSFKHLKTYTEELERLGIPKTRKAPIILPDYRGEKVLSRMVNINIP